MRYLKRKVLFWLLTGVVLGVVLVGTVYADSVWKQASQPGMEGMEMSAPHAQHQPVAGTVPQANAAVEVGSNFYSPASITIHVGDTVTWTRVDGFHNVLADDGSFRLGDTNGNPSGSWTTASHQFNQPGTFKYHCEVHGTSMSGQVIVQGNETPITSLTATSNSPTLLGNTTNFVATIISGTNVSYAWNFGDGSNGGTGTVVSHTYAATGIYTATVTASNSLGNQQASTVVHVTNAIVDVDDFAFAPISVTVNLGDMVTWVRKGGFHNVRADDNSFILGGANGAPSSSWTAVSHKFTQAGAVRYYCQVHGAPNGVGMAGVVLVQGSNPAESKNFLPFVIK